MRGFQGGQRTDRGGRDAVRAEGQRDLETELFYIGLVFLAAGGCLWALYWLALRGRLPQVPCFFSAVVGIYCPGCGGTRAVCALLEGKFLLAVWYHPLVPYLTVGFGGFMATQGLHRLGAGFIRGWRFRPWYLYGAFIITGCNFLIKNALRLVWGITM